MIRLGFLHGFDRADTTSAEHLAEFATIVEDVGVESLWVGEHVAIAADYEPRYPYSADGRLRLRPGTVLPDPLEWLAFLAALTRRVRLGTGVLLLPLHPPAVLAKRVATLDALSGGRVLLGVGVGWQREEYDAVGVPFEGRGARAEEYVHALRVLWRDDEATFHGRHVAFDRLVSEPKPPRRSVPVLVGGGTAVAARRAGRVGDGWFPSSVTPDDLARLLPLVHAEARAAGRDPDALDVTVMPTIARPGRVFDVDLVRRFADAGVTRVVISAQEGEGTGNDAVRRLLETYADRVLARVG